MARHDESELTLINERNIHALHEALKIERDRVSELNKKLDNALNSVVMLQQDIMALRGQLATIMNMR